MLFHFVLLLKSLYIFGDCPYICGFVSKISFYSLLKTIVLLETYRQCFIYCSLSLHISYDKFFFIKFSEICMTLHYFTSEISYRQQSTKEEVYER